MTEKKNKINSKNEKGMTLLEVLVAMFVFVVIMVAVVQIFGNSASSYRNTVRGQRNLEDAQYIFSQMTKTFRTSTIIECNPSSCDASTDEIKVFDYSRGSENCIKFKISENNIMIGLKNASTSHDCDANVDFAAAELNQMTAGRVENMNFNVTKSINGAEPGGPVVGKVTISAKVCTDINGSSCSANGVVQIQSTVSLRDFDTVYEELI
jgi:prepilin-type N-terminal cleavage/methylation domain-containing protein